MYSRTILDVLYAKNISRIHRFFSKWDEFVKKWKQPFLDILQMANFYTQF